jgi:uncharacterized protein DUF3489
MAKSRIKISNQPRTAIKPPVVKAKSKTSPAPNTPTPTQRENTKQAKLIALLRRPGGATIDNLAKATGWQRHTVRGAISGALKKKLRLSVTSDKTKDGERVYRIAD